MITVNRKKKLNPILMKVIFMSVLFHVVAAFVAGIMTIANYVIQEDTQFEEPPAVVEEKPPPNVKVQIKPQQPKATQTRRLTMRPVTSIAVANVDVNLPSMDQNFTVSAGIGGVVGGSLLGGARGNFGFGLSDVSVFGLRTRAERILFIIDTNRRMVTDEKGGLNSYRVIKDEIADMVGNLSAGTLFNIMLQDRRRIKLFKPQLVPAGSELHQELVRWIGAVNANAAKPGLEGVAGAVHARLNALPENELHKALSWGHGDNDTAFMTQVALEQSADAIFMITGSHRGFGNVVAPPSERQIADWEKYRATTKYQEALAAHRKEEPEMRQRVAKEMAKINADRAKKELPPRVLARRSNDVRGNARELELKWKHPHPGGGAGHTDVEPWHVEKYFKEVMEQLYLNRGQQLPSLNIVLFLAGDEAYDKSWEDQLKSYVRFFRGKSRIIRGENEIKSARSAMGTKN